MFHFWDLSSAGRAPALQAGGHRFEPYRSHFFVNVSDDTRFEIGSPVSKNADVAQLAEQLICNQQVNGSSPLIGLAVSIYTYIMHMAWMVSRVAKGGRL